MKYTEEEKKSLKFLTDKRDEAYGLMQFEDGEIYQLAEEEFNNYLTIEEIIDKQQKEIERLENKDKEYMKIQNNNLEWQEKYNELKKKIENSKQFQVYISGMRSGKELLNKYINDSIPKDNIREKIKDLRYNESLGFEQSFEETFKIEVLEELLGDE